MKNRGFSLLEVLLVLALSAVVAIVAVRYYSEVRQSQKVTTAQSQLASIAEAVQKCLSGSQPGATDECTNIDDLVADKFLTEYFKKSPWNTEYNIKLSSGNKLSISVVDTPSDACTKIRNRLKSASNVKVICLKNRLTYTTTLM